MPPNIPNPVRKVTRMEMLTIELRNRDSGMIGSGTCVSMTTKTIDIRPAKAS